MFQQGSVRVFHPRIRRVGILSDSGTCARLALSGIDVDLRGIIGSKARFVRLGPGYGAAKGFAVPPLLSPDGLTHVPAHQHRAQSAKPCFTACNSFEMRIYEK